MKREPGSWGITGPTCQWWDINAETWSYGFEVGSKADDLVMYKK
jgi:hypothetical protein